MVSKPYIEQKQQNKLVRTFNSTTDSAELVWHRDKNDRKVTVVNNTDWLFQMDNEVPVQLTKDISIFIPKETYHRVIKGTTDLIVEIIE